MTAKIRQICRHCEKCGVNRPRGLCWSCYYKPEIKALYGAGSLSAKAAMYARIGVGLSYEGEPTEPTDALPGTEEKIVILASRAEKGLGLHHPKDAKGLSSYPRRNLDQTPLRTVMRKLVR